MKTTEKTTNLSVAVFLFLVALFLLTIDANATVVTKPGPIDKAKIIAGTGGVGIHFIPRQFEIQWSGNELFLASSLTLSDQETQTLANLPMRSCATFMVASELQNWLAGQV